MLDQVVGALDLAEVGFVLGNGDTALAQVGLEHLLSGGSLAHALHGKTRRGQIRASAFPANP
jgi:hypothetical protein